MRQLEPSAPLRAASRTRALLRGASRAQALLRAACCALALLVTTIPARAAGTVPHFPGFVFPDREVLPHIALVGIGSGIAVALIEETVMRGAIHTAIERESGPWAAALLTALLFAITHLFAKASIPTADLAWRSGFDLAVRSFAPLSHFASILDSLLSWFVIGLVLSLTRVLTGNIAVAIGLHAGWVVVLRMLQQGTVLQTGQPFSPWVGSFDGLVGYWLLPWGACVALGLWGLRARWVPAARSQ